ncbi:MAG: hypothetical protein K2H46_08235 [Muribaculaceae bacterium]|nr:hypothetical protein [Muribaculaceae bacterium]
MGKLIREDERTLREKERRFPGMPLMSVKEIKEGNPYETVLDWMSVKFPVVRRDCQVNAP